MKKLNKIMILILSLVFTLSIMIGCGGENKSSAANTNKTESTKLLTAVEFEQMYSDISKFKGNKVDFYAKVFTQPEKDDKGTYFQCYANNNNNLNTMVGIGDPKSDVKEGDIVHIIGTIKDKFEGENGFGAKIVAPIISADKIEKADYATAFAPAIKTVELNKEINQHGYIIKVNKVEFAKQETRVYLTITNNSKDKISFYSFNTKATQGNKQFEIKDNYDTNYPELKSEILPNIKEDGIITFQPMNPDGENVKLILEGNSDNYDLDFKPFTFDIPSKK